MSGHVLMSEGGDTDRSAQIQAQIRTAEARFAELSEEDQILYLLSRKLGAVREVATDLDSRLSGARAFITREYGPRFADRVMGTPELFAKLHLEPTGHETNGDLFAQTAVVDD